MQLQQSKEFGKDIMQGKKWLINNLNNTIIGLLKFLMMKLLEVAYSKKDIVNQFKKVLN